MADARFIYKRLAVLASEVAAAQAQHTQELFHRGNLLLAGLIGGHITTRDFEPESLSLVGAKLTLPFLLLDHTAHVRREHRPLGIISHSWRKPFGTAYVGDVRISELPLRSWYADGAQVILLMRTETPGWFSVDEMSRAANEERA